MAEIVQFLARRQLPLPCHTKAAHVLATLLVSCAKLQVSRGGAAEDIWDPLVDAAAGLLKLKSHRVCVLLTHSLRRVAALATTEVRTSPSVQAPWPHEVAQADGICLQQVAVAIARNKELVGLVGHLIDTGVEAIAGRVKAGDSFSSLQGGEIQRMAAEEAAEASEVCALLVEAISSRGPGPAEALLDDRLLRSLASLSDVQVGLAGLAHLPLQGRSRLPHIRRCQSPGPAMFPGSRKGQRGPGVCSCGSLCSRSWCIGCARFPSRRRHAGLAPKGTFPAPAHGAADVRAATPKPTDRSVSGLSRNEFCNLPSRLASNPPVAGIFTLGSIRRFCWMRFARIQNSVLLVDPAGGQRGMSGGGGARGGAEHVAALLAATSLCREYGAEMVAAAILEPVGALEVLMAMLPQPPVTRGPAIQDAGTGNTICLHAGGLCPVCWNPSLPCMQDCLKS